MNQSFAESVCAAMLPLQIPCRRATYRENKEEALAFVVRSLVDQDMALQVTELAEAFATNRATVVTPTSVYVGLQKNNRSKSPFLVA
jgi:hypothetical protein